MIEFKLNEEEEKLAKKFMDEHLHPDVKKGPIGGSLAFTFIPTYIGDAVSVKCLICGKKENITDYKSW